MAAHRYWRLYVTEKWGGVHAVVRGLELRSAVGGSDLTSTFGGTSSASNTYSDKVPANAFDHNTATVWATDVALPGWLKWDFGAGNAQEVMEVVLDSGPGSSGYATTNFVKTATLQYSDDGTTWVAYIYISAPQATGTYATPWTELPVITAALSPPIPLLSLHCGASVLTQPPRASVFSNAGASMFVTAPAGSVLSGAGAAVSVVAPAQTLSASGHDSSGEQSASLTAPSPSLAFYAGAYAGALTAPSPALASSGVVTASASSVLSAPRSVLTSTGTVSGMATATLNAPRPNLVGYSGAVCSITLTGSPTLQASATTGGIGGAALSCPLFELTSSATAQNHGGADLLAPSPRMGQTAQAWLAAPGARLTAIGSAVVTATYEAYAVNLKHTTRPGIEPVDEATRYTNFPFTHVIRHKGSYYGANSTGLYLLEGTTDDTAPIAWAVKTAMTDFKSPQRKTVASACFGGRLGPADTITLHAGEGAQTQPYSYTTPRGALAQNYRQAFGKGIKQHRYYALAASGSGEMALDNIDLDVHNMTRRI